MRAASILLNILSNWTQKYSKEDHSTQHCYLRRTEHESWPFSFTEKPGSIIFYTRSKTVFPNPCFKLRIEETPYGKSLRHTHKHMTYCISHSLTHLNWENLSRAGRCNQWYHYLELLTEMFVNFHFVALELLWSQCSW